MYLESDGAVSRVQETGGLKQVFRSKGNAICVFLLLCFTAFIGRIGWEWAIMTAELEPAQMAAEMLPLPAGETRVPEARPTSFPEACNVLLAQASQSAGAPSGQQDETSVVWVGGAEGYTNQILSMLDVYLGSPVASFTFFLFGFKVPLWKKRRKQVSEKVALIVRCFPKP